MNGNSMKGILKVLRYGTVLKVWPWLATAVINGDGEISRDFVLSKMLCRKTCSPQ
jgi:hypothetical protein